MTVPRDYRLRQSPLNILSERTTLLRERSKKTSKKRSQDSRTAHSEEDKNALSKFRAWACVDVSVRGQISQHLYILSNPGATPTALNFL